MRLLPRLSLLTAALLTLGVGHDARADAPVVPEAPTTPAPSPAPALATPLPKVDLHAATQAGATGTLPVSGKPLGAGLPKRHEGKRLVWDKKFNRMDAPEMWITGGAVAVALTTNIVKPLNTGIHGGILFDDAIRNAIRPTALQARLDVRDASDVGLGLITTFPILVDSLMVAYWYRGSDEVALQMALIDAEAIALASAVQGTTSMLVGRERPYGLTCGTALANNSIDCETSGRYRSFFSGHSELSFTSAALICAHHLRLHLFESGADAGTCVSAELAAATIATFRVVGDMHYTSDVLIGALVGTGIGLGVPLLHHYRTSDDVDAVQKPVAHLVPTANGLAVVGTF